MFFRRKIKALGRAGVLYRGDRDLRVDAEFHFDPLGVTIYCDSPLKNASSKEVIEFPEEEKRRILREIADYFTRKGYTVELHREMAAE